MLTSFFHLNLLNEKKQNFVEETSEAPERQSKSDSPALLKPAWYMKRDPLNWSFFSFPRAHSQKS